MNSDEERRAYNGVSARQTEVVQRLYSPKWIRDVFQHLLADDHVATRGKRHRWIAEIEGRILEGLIFPPGSRIPMRLAAYLDSSRVRIEVLEKSPRSEERV